jgi:hypothetical protein
MKLHSEPLYTNRGHTFQVSNWVDETGRCWFQERAYFPHNWNKETSVHYWVTDVCYADLKLAKKEGRMYGFVVEREPYCDDDDPRWFPVFNNIDKCADFIRAKGNNIEFE